MFNLPNLFQVRKNCIISYTDFSSLPKVLHERKIESSGKYSKSAQKKFKRYLELWSYSMDGEKNNMSFITLTLSSKMNVKTNYTLLMKWLLEKLMYRYGVFNYAWKIEFQENGNLHFHIIADKEIDWKIVRSQWNKLQSEHVDEYQLKHKLKYKNGYYFDTEMKYKNGELVDQEKQQKRYKSGKKGNWRNPNSTDVKIVECINGIDGYISKYASKADKKEESKIYEHSIKRFYGCSDSLRLLKYCTIAEFELTNQCLKDLQNSNTREVKNEMQKIVCWIIDKVDNEYIRKREKETIEANKIVLKNNSIKNEIKLVQKEIDFYDKIYG